MILSVWNEFYDIAVKEEEGGGSIYRKFAGNGQTTLYLPTASLVKI